MIQLPFKLTYYYYQLYEYKEIFFYAIREGLKKVKNSPKKYKIFPKMVKLLLDKQIFASSDARFCRGARSNSRYTQNFVHNTRNFSLDMILSP